MDFEDNNLAVLEYDKALARIFVSSVEVNGWGRWQLVVSGSKGTVNINEYIPETKQNPFSYEHDYLVQKVLSEIVGGVRINAKNID